MEIPNTKEFWIQLERNGERKDSIPVTLNSDALTCKLVEAALKLEAINDIPADKVTLKCTWNNEVKKTDDPVGELQNSTPTEPVLLIIKDEAEGPSAKRRKLQSLFPTLGDKSVREVAQNNIFRRCEEHPIAHHWFAIQLYNAYLSAKQQLATHTPVISLALDTHVYTIRHSHLQHAVEAIKSAASLHTIEENQTGRGVMASRVLRTQEVTYSCLYARALDRFLFKDATFGAVLHQGPSRCRKDDPEQADIYIVPLHDHKPGSPLVQSDVKLNNFEGADMESTLYSINGTSVAHECDTWPVLLGIPGTPSHVELQVHVPTIMMMNKLTVCSGAPFDASILCTLYAAVHYLCGDAVHYLCGEQLTTHEYLELPQPFKEFNQYRKIGYWQHWQFTFTSETQVYLNTSTNTVHKIFKDETMHPNVDLILKVGQLEGVIQENMTTDGKIRQLCYKYIEGHTTPETLKQFVGVIAALHIIHREGFVHGDIRCENMIFTTDGERSYLIDFDYAQKEGEGYYPEGYNSFDILRHPDATSSKQMKKEHDRFALAHIMKEVVPFEPEHRATANDLISQVMDPSVDLETICTKLSQLKF